ncbi:MAG: hypothetical protein IJP29_04850 [Lachnospiraceae bacterium]|nr:hypothetical protein [Lachnospiraceae bacterium]
MNAQTFNQVVNPVFAVLATPKQNTRHSKQQFKERNQKQKDFDSLFTTTCETLDEMLLFNDTGCYGKDARPVVRIVSSFNRTM